jgi:molybdate transport system ATP-binding protein
MIHINIKKALHGSHGDMNLDVKLEIQKGEFIALMGESGSGKTTLLRILAGLEKAEGDISVEDLVWLDDTKRLPPQQREIGFVFQDYALFDNMTVEQNLLFVNADKTLANTLLSMTELTGLASRNVRSLSGGQKQRVSLCRAMMNKPKLLLMDEPLSALDEKMKEKLQHEIAKFHKVFGTTMIMVSHDMEVTYALADRVLVLKQGKVIANGRKEEILVEKQTLSYALHESFDKIQ